MIEASKPGERIAPEVFEMEPERTIVRGETRLDVWKRRSCTVPAIVLVFVLLVVALPVWLPLAVLADALCGFRSALARSLLFLLVYLGCEIVGVAACIFISMTSPRRPRDAASDESYFQRHFRLQRWWAGALMGWVVRLFRIRFEVEGLECLDRPMILMLSHSSIADTLLASEFVSKPHGIHLRYVLKRELLLDPCLDIVGHRLPNYFVDRDSDDPSDALEDLRGLVAGLRENEGVLIYPEGTRFSESKRRQVIARMVEQGKAGMAERASTLRHTLPPRVGGPIALLEANPGLDVVFCAHTGFEVVARPLDVIRGSLLDARIAVRFRRVPYAAIPHEARGRIDWLFGEWQEIDRWIEARRPQASWR